MNVITWSVICERWLFVRTCCTTTTVATEPLTLLSLSITVLGNYHINDLFSYIVFMRVVMLKVRTPLELCEIIIIVPQINMYYVSSHLLWSCIEVMQHITCICGFYIYPIAFSRNDWNIYTKARCAQRVQLQCDLNAQQRRCHPFAEVFMFVLRIMRRQRQFKRKT